MFTDDAFAILRSWHTYNASDPALSNIESGNQATIESATVVPHLQPASGHNGSVAERSRLEEISNPQDSLSQLLARILDQLSLSAWLPSAALVMATVFLAKMHSAKGAVSGAFDLLSRFDASDIALCLAAVVVGTVVTQAFEFEAIRLLEGYWGPSQLAQSLAAPGCSWHRWKRNRLRTRKAVHSEQVWKSVEAMAVAQLDDRSAASIDALKCRVTGAPTKTTAKLKAAAAEVVWDSAAAPKPMRALEQIVERLNDYPPVNHRVLPTKLGNTIRASEDRAIGDSAERLEGWVMRRFERLPLSMQSEHDHYRTRLDLYCSMVFVAATCVPIAALALGDTESYRIGVALPAAAMVLLYRAAIAAARGYGTMLEVIAEEIAQQDSDQTRADQSALAKVVARLRRRLRHGDVVLGAQGR